MVEDGLQDGGEAWCRVTRTEHDGTVTLHDFCRPNGLAFSVDERKLYIVDTRREPSHIRVFDVTEDAALTGGGIFAECDHGRFDGIRLDDAGRVWAAAWDGAHRFDPDGTLLLPEPVANLTFGGPQRNHLFITAGPSVYTLRAVYPSGRVEYARVGGLPPAE